MALNNPYITQTGQTYYEGPDGTAPGNQITGDEDYGSYQFISLDNIINNFIVAYVGEGKIISNVKRSDIQFHAMRALQELSFDTFKSIKAYEISLPPSLNMILPQDYVNYVKLTWSDAGGTEHIIYPTSKTSNPTDVQQNAADSSVDPNLYSFDNNELITDTSSDTWEKYKGASNISNSGTTSSPDQDTDLYNYNEGQRYGIDPQHAQSNGTFFIDPNTGLIHFSSNMTGKTIILKYISDSLGTYSEMKVHKFAEEAMYKWIAHAILATRANVQEYLVQRFKKERFAEVRKAKLRLSNIKIEELTQILRGKSKQIKH